MNKFKISVFFKKFGFLLGIITDPDRVEEVHVKRISPELLAVTPSRETCVGSLVNINDNQRILLLNEEGRVLTEVKQREDNHSNYAHEDDTQYEGETVGEALLRLKDPDAIKYAIEVHMGFEVENHASVGGYSVSLYRPPVDFSLKGWVEEQLRRAGNIIDAEVAVINAEA